MLSLLPACTNLYFHSDFIDHGLVYYFCPNALPTLSYRDYKNCMKEMDVLKIESQQSFSCVKARVVSTATW